MRSRVALALLLAFSPLAAGCLEPRPAAPDGGSAVGPGGGGEEGFSAQREPLALHAWSRCGFCEPPSGFSDPQARLFAMDANGSALLLHLNPAEGATRVEIHPDVDLPRPTVEPLVEVVGAREWLGAPAVLVAKAEHARVPDAARDALLGALRDAWAQPPPPDGPACADCAGLGIFARVLDGEVARIEAVHPEAAVETPFHDLVRAFRDAEQVFMPGAGQTPPTPNRPPQPFEMTRPATAACAEVSVRVEPMTVAPGEGANVTARVANRCDAPFQVQGANGCSLEGLEAVLIVNGTTYHLIPKGAAQQVRVCTMILPGPLDVPVGGAHEVSWWWNGTLAQHEGACCAREVAPPPGAWEVVARVTSPHDLPQANATLVVRAP